MEERLKVLVIEKDDMLREKIAGLVSKVEDVKLVGQARSMANLAGIMWDSRPDVILFEAGCIRGNEELLALVRKQAGGVKLVLMTEGEGDGFWRSGMEEKISVDAIVDKKKVYQEIVEFIGREYR